MSRVIYLKYGLVIVLLLVAAVTDAQPIRVARIQPDALAPGMTIALEILAYESDHGVFGSDGLATPDVRVALENPADSSRIIFGPHVVSWNGRLLQVPVMVPHTASIGGVRFRIERGIRKSDTLLTLQIVNPQPSISINGSALLGDGAFGTLTPGNTLVVNSLDISSSNPMEASRFSLEYILNNPASLRLHPMTILSRGPIKLRNTSLSVSADSINGGPGGGGGGGGYTGTGGYGYTGGGSSDTEFVETNIGSGLGPNKLYGGPSKTGVFGGRSDEGDQGGGGGTGNPYGSSGTTGARHAPSFDGGFGGASSGGEAPGVAYGGGGGGFSTAGEHGAGLGDNGGRVNGGRFLAPMMGGSGGGAGNSYEVEVDTNIFSAGSGGGGGGAMTLISYESIELTGATLRADGARGTSGDHPREGGGGGGSGGGILLGARDTVKLDFAQFSTSGGIGGLGGGASDSSARGGNGGHGRIRFDGNVPCTNCLRTPVYGPTLKVFKTQQNGKQLKLSGFAGVGSDLGDTIRIFYRSRHTSWLRTDAIRKPSGGVFVWEKTIDAPPDSLLFVAVYAKVNNPQRSFANYEPDWLMGHLSSAIISVIPRSELVISPDTLDIGCIKTGSCIDGIVYVENRGEELLIIDTIYTTDTHFKILSSPTALPGYDPSNIIIQYCPDNVQSDTTKLIIIAGGKTYDQTIIFGCGIDKDRRIQIEPAVLDFDEQPVVDSCKFSFITITSVGKDTAYIDLTKDSLGPFTILDRRGEIIQLAKGESITLQVRFCPEDTGFFYASFILTERRDSVVFQGIGTRKLLAAPDTLWIGEQCVGTCIDTLYTLYSIGNRGVEISGIFPESGITLPVFTPHRLESHASELIRFTICFDSLGDYYRTISYGDDADNDTIVTVIKYRGTGIDLSVDAVDLEGICIGTCDSAFATIHNMGTAFTIDSVVARSNIFEVELPALPMTISDSLQLKVKKCADADTEFSDTLFIYITQGECDSIVKLPLHAAGSDAKPILSHTSIQFGEIELDSCVFDTITLDNPCPADISVDISSLAPPFALVEPSTPVTVKGGSSLQLIYRFCPIDSLSYTDQDTIRSNGTTLLISLAGKGKRKEISQIFVRFALDHTDQAIVGEQFFYSIVIDSASRINEIDSIHGDLYFDPIVVQPTAPLNKIKNGWHVIGREWIPGIFTFDAARTMTVMDGPFMTIPMQALRSRRDSTAVTLQNIRIIPQGLTRSDTGSIKTNTCAEPPSNIVIPGEYKLGEPTPNPSQTTLTIPLTLGAEGIVHLKLFNTQGALVYSESNARTKGDHLCTLNTAGIPSGIYVLEAESWGWRERKTILIVK